MKNILKKRLWSIGLAVLIVCCCIACFAGCSNGDYIGKTAKNLSTYDIECGYDDEAHLLSAVMKLDYVNDTGKELTELRFHLYPNAYRENAKNKLVSASKATRAYPNGYDYGEITIEYAKHDGQDVAFEIAGDDSNILVLPLVQPLACGKRTNLEISFETQLANIWHRLGYGDNTVNLNNWFPLLCKFDAESGEWLQDAYCCVGDPFVSDIANFCVALTVEEDFVVASGADVIEAQQTADGGATRYLLQALSVRDFSIVMSKNFNVLETEVDGIKVKYYYFDDANAEQILELSKQAIEFFCESFGKYPYKTLAVAQSDFCEGGMEYPRLAMVTYGLEENFYKKAVVHEIAHQWWCCLVGNDQIRSAWMDEGLAEYSAYLFFEERDFGIDAKAEMRASKQSLHNFLEITKNYFKETDTSINRSLTEYRNETEYAYLNYTKAMIMFDDMREMMGKTKFLKALKIYFKDFKLTVATPTDLINCFSVAYGADMSQLFETYIMGKEKTIAEK